MSAGDVVPYGALLRTAHERHADRVAVRDEHRSLTFAELGRRATRVGRGLLALGARPGDRVGLIGPNSCAWVEAEQGLTLAGMVRVGILPRLHELEARDILLDCEAFAVVVDAGWLERAGTDWVPESTRVVVLGDGPVVPGALPFEELVAKGDDELLPMGDPDAVSVLMYTSGSTGRPKGVLGTHRSIGTAIRNTLAEMPDLGPSDTILHTAPISHFSASLVHAGLAAGATSVMSERFDAAAVTDRVAAGEVTVLPLVPTQITLLLEELGRRGFAGPGLGRLRLLPYSGSAIGPDRASTARRLLGDVVLQFYGASESPLPIAALHPADHTSDVPEGGLPRVASAGRPSRYVGVEIRSPAGDPLPAGAVGEVAVGGEHLTPGYWRQPEATAEAIGPDGWLRTGDVGYLDEDGYLFLVDRTKDMIVTGGFNVYPREVENVISALPGVRDVAVVGAPDDRWGEAITAIVSLGPDVDLGPEDVVAHCRASLGAYKVPKRVEIVDEVPKGPTGKIAKAKIRDELWAAHARRV